MGEDIRQAKSEELREQALKHYEEASNAISHYSNSIPRAINYYWDNHSDKYEYHVFTWGGFYNDHNKKIHGYAKGHAYFNSKEEREEYITKLKKQEELIGQKLVSEGKFNDSCLAIAQDEGCNVRNLPVAHRLVKYKGKQYYSTNEWNWLESMSVILYHIEYKWYPGFNDDIVEETLGEKIDYRKVIVLDEWVTGSFKIENND